MIPHDLAPWTTAYQWFRAWTADGTWARVHDTLRDQVRIDDGRDPQPSAAVLDSQSAKSAEGGEQIGYDAGKRVRGRKRHLLVDTLGLMLVGIVHSASVQDRAGAKLVEEHPGRLPVRAVAASAARLLGPPARVGARCARSAAGWRRGGGARAGPRISSSSGTIRSVSNLPSAAQAGLPR